jgi:DUF4097 and DUF4098 domain-containing protein YvlB
MKYVALAMLPGLMIGAVTADARSIDETVDAAANGTLEIENVAGSVEIEAWDRNTVHVAGELGDDVESVEIDTKGNRVIVKVIYESNNISDGADLVIKAPAGSKLDVQCVSADVTATGLTGSQRLVSVSGDIRGEGVVDDAKYASVSGDVDLVGAGDKADREISVKSVSGDLRVKGASGEVNAKSVSGDVMIDAGTVTEAELASTSGDLRLVGKVQKDARVELKTMSGDVNVELGDLFAGEVQAKTVTGDIENCFGPAAEERDSGPGARLSFTEGSGDGELRISTMSGDIDICR